MVARRVGAAVRCATPPLTFAYYSYWAGMPHEGIEAVLRPEQRRVVPAFPTNDGLTVVAVQGAAADFAALRADIAGNFATALALAPDLRARVEAGRRAERWVGTGDLPNFVRAAHGPGWALVGDAGYHRDPLPAQRISDAFRDAEALDAGFAGRQPLRAALADYERRRDVAAMPGYEATVRACALAAPPPEVLRLRAALRGYQADTDRFYGVEFGTVAREECYSPESLARITGGATGAPA